MRPLALVMAALVLAPSVGAVDVRSLTFQAVPAFAGFDFPVSFAFAPDGRVFVTEKGGAIKVVDGDTAVWAQLDVKTVAEQGLLGLAVHPNFASNGWVYVYYTDAGNDTNRVARLMDVGGRGVDLTVVFDGISNADFHNGGIVTFARDGTLLVSTGDATMRSSAQTLDSWSGKILRLNPEGSVPVDNPFPGSPVYSYGHRNVFGLAVDPEAGDVWATENGPIGNDEVNRIAAGGNYGWPEVQGVANRPGFVDAAYVFGLPSPALTQATFHTGDVYPAENRGALFFGGWNSGSVYRAVLTPNRRDVAGVEAVHTVDGWGVLDVESGPDGRLYFSGRNRDSGEGAIFALESVAPVGATQELHGILFAAAAAAVGILVIVYVWKRRR